MEIKTDIQIAQENEMAHISQIAAESRTCQRNT